MSERTITRADLAEAVYAQVGLSRNESASLVEVVLDEIADTLIKGVSLQPDIQYVINPAADRTIRNALVLGLRLTLGWSAH